MRRNSGSRGKSVLASPKSREPAVSEKASLFSHISAPVPLGNLSWPSVQCFHLKHFMFLDIQRKEGKKKRRERGSKAGKEGGRRKEDREEGEGGKERERERGRKGSCTFSRALACPPVYTSPV